MTAKYGVFTAEAYEAWMPLFETLKEARNHAEHWRKRPKPHRSPTQITVVKIISEHLEGDWV